MMTKPSSDKQWMYIPTAKACKAMLRYGEDDTCPKCGKGRMILEVVHGSLGDVHVLKCYWSESCDYEEDITDVDCW
jgi:DNA-directed RNA polymerase subunit M/transcription elongation factor TFIIS